MKPRSFSWRALLSVALLALGSASIVLSLGADQLGIGAGRFGAKQTALAAVGGLSVLGGLILASTRASSRARGWYQYARDSVVAAPIPLVAAWFGLISGWGQMLVLFYRKGGDGQLLGMGIDYGWLVPLANLVLFLALGLVLHLFHRRWPRALSIRKVVFLLGWLAIWGLLLMIPRVGPWALALLAAGVAFQLSRLAVKHGRGFSALVRFSMGWPALLRKPPMPEAAVAEQTEVPGGPIAAPPMPTRRDFLVGAASGIAAVALGTHAGLIVTERRAVARLIRPTTWMPNVLLIVLDTVRAPSLSLYGYGRPTTPNLERLATQGTVFTRAIAASPWTLPSHASMFTGRLPHELSVGWWAGLNNAYPTLAEVLSHHGFETAGFVGNTLYCSREFGLNRGFAYYRDYPVTPAQAAQYSSFGSTVTKNSHMLREDFGRKQAEEVNHEFLRWLSRGPHRPFFAFLNYYDAHAPYTPPAPFGLQFTGKKRFQSHLPTPEPRTPEDVSELQSAYEGCIAYLDSQVGSLVSELKTRGVLDDTLVIITSDHGEEFAEHGMLSHGNSLYLPGLHVPLLMLFPPLIPTGFRVTTPISLQNLGATILQLVNLNAKPIFPGDSFARYWHAPVQVADPLERALLSQVSHRPNSPDWYPIARGDMTSVVVGSHHYIQNGDGREELYDFEVDSLEAQNLVETEEGRQAIARLRKFLPQA